MFSEQPTRTSKAKSWKDNLPIIPSMHRDVGVCMLECARSLPEGLAYALLGLLYDKMQNLLQRTVVAGVQW